MPQISNDLGSSSIKDANSLFDKMPPIEKSSVVDIDSDNSVEKNEKEGFMLTDKNLKFIDNRQNKSVNKRAPSLRYSFKRINKFAKKEPTSYMKLKKNLLTRILTKRRSGQSSISPETNRGRSMISSLPPTPRLKDPAMQSQIKKFPILPSLEELRQK